jgi:hypothetical protein
MKRRFPLFLSLILGAAAFAHAQTSTLFYTDLTSGPAGTIVTAYGANLGNVAKVNGQQAQTIQSSPSQISFVVPNVSSGSITVGQSNSLPFTVRAGHIYYVSVNGTDNAAGSQAAPWATIPYAFNKATCGDIVYAENGVKTVGEDNYNAALSVQKRCTVATPVALVGYPGATVTVGSPSGPEFGIRNPDVQGDNYNGLVFANLHIRGGNEALEVTGSQYWRIVGNDIQVPNGGGLSGVVLIDQSSNVKFLGNNLHDSGAGGTKYYHSFYATTNSNHIEVGWNLIQNNKSCRGVQFYSTSGSPQYDLIVHDNVIHGQECDGINFSTVDATQGPVLAYNNLVYHVGLGGTTDGLPNYACIASLGYGASGGEVDWWDNTVADCGPAGGSTAGAFTVQSGSPLVKTAGNLVVQNPGEVLYSRDSNSQLVTSTKDVVILKGPSGVVDATYHPVANSPAVGGGIGISKVVYDLAGSPRLTAGASDAGAYMFSKVTPLPPPTGAPKVTMPVNVSLITAFTDGTTAKATGQLSVIVGSDVTGLSGGNITISGTLPNGAKFTAIGQLTAQ